MNPRRIDWIITGMNVVGGAEAYVYQTLPRLIRAAPENWQVRLVTLRRGGSLLTALQAAGAPVIELGMQSKLDMQAVLRLWQLWHRDPPHIVHTHLFHAGILGRILARAAGVPHVIVHQHGTEQGRSRLRSGLDGGTSGLVDAYIATCLAVQNQLIRREGIPPSKIHLIHPGLDALDVAGLARPQPWPAPPGTPVIGFVGRLVPEKNLPVLLQALALLRQRCQPFHAILVGQGPEQQRLADLAAALDLASQVTWAGIQTNVRPWLAHFDIFVLPSAWEGISMALQEAMSAGLPVVATAVGGTPEIVDPALHGRLVAPGDASALAEALGELLAAPELRAKYGWAARQTITQKFSIEENVRQIMLLYQQLFAAAPGGRQA